MELAPRPLLCVFYDQWEDMPKDQRSHPLPGSMFYIQFSSGHCDTHEPPCSQHLMVVCPDGHWWDIDSRASNCTKKDDKVHHCWVRHGKPPHISVGKAGITCEAGAGSILTANWHGHLRNGQLVD